MKIDITTIEGYADMTAEEKLAFLENYEFEVPKPDYTGWIEKTKFDKTASEAADWRRKYEAKLTDEEKKSQAHEEELTTLREAVAQMETEKKAANYKAEYLKIGYDEALAESTAKALINGDTMTVFANHSQFLEAHDKQMRAAIMDETPKPPAGTGTPAKPSIKDISKIEDRETRLQTIANNIDLYE